MTNTNFIPHRRQVLRQQGRRKRLWMIVCVLYALPLAGLASAAWFTIGGDSEGYAGQLTTTLEQIDQTHLAIREVRGRLAPARARLEATESISLRPDWSILLAHVATQLADDVFLSRVELNPSSMPSVSMTPVSQPARADAGSLVFTVGGYGRTQTAVSDFVVQLEATPLFKKVTIVQTTRRKLMADEAVGFELSCLLSGAEAEMP